MWGFQTHTRWRYLSFFWLLWLKPPRVSRSVFLLFFTALIDDEAFMKGIDHWQSLRLFCLQGTPRRKKKVVHKTASADDKKLQGSLKKLSVSTITGIEEVRMRHLLSFLSMLWINMCLFFSIHQQNFFPVLLFSSLPPSGEHDKERWHSDPLQQPQGAGVPVSQHLLHLRPRRDQAADWDAPRHPEPTGSRQHHQPAEVGRAVPTARWVGTWVVVKRGFQTWCWCHAQFKMVCKTKPLTDFYILCSNGLQISEGGNSGGRGRRCTRYDWS